MVVACRNILHILHLRRWKYDESVIQHWVETRQHGSLIHIDSEKTEEVTNQDPDSTATLAVNLDFDEGPGHPDANASGAPGTEGAMPSDVACKQVCKGAKLLILNVSCVPVSHTACKCMFHPGPCTFSPKFRTLVEHWSVRGPRC